MNNTLIVFCTIFFVLPMIAADNRTFPTYKKRRLYHLVLENQGEQKGIMPLLISSKNAIAARNCAAKHMQQARLR
jgi:hypothetical protein